MSKSVVGLMFTRYFWMLPVGVVVGASVSAGYFFYAARNLTEYTAVVPFQVLAPMQPIVSSVEPIVVFQDDVEQVIHRQEFIFQQDEFLLDILRCSEFHPMGRDCAWLSANKRDPLQGLKRDLRMVPRTDWGTFEIQMSSPEPAEACALVTAATQVYLEKLHSSSIERRTLFIQNLEDAVKKAQDIFQIKNDAIVEFSKRKGIDILKSRFEIEKASLITLDSNYMREDLAARSAEEKYETIRKSKAEGKEIELSAELALSVENDSTLKALQSTLLNLEQERAAQSVVVRTTGPRLDEIGARIIKVEEQIAQTRRRLAADASDHMEKMLHDAATEGRFRANYLRDSRKRSEDIVTGIGQDLLVWQQRVDELKEQGELLSKMRSQLSLAQANQATNDIRVAQMGEPVIPKTPSWPQWWNLVPIGAAAGLLMSLFAAGVAAVRYRRKLNAPPALPSEPASGSPAPVSPA